MKPLLACIDSDLGLLIALIALATLAQAALLARLLGKGRGGR